MNENRVIEGNIFSRCRAHLGTVYIIANRPVITECYITDCIWHKILCSEGGQHAL